LCISRNIIDIEDSIPTFFTNDNNISKAGSDRPSPTIAVMQSLRPLTRSLTTTTTTRQSPRCLFRLCLQTCLFHNTTAVRSGHSRWSKIKHDKGANDAAKNRQRSVFAQEIATASRCTFVPPRSTLSPHSNMPSQYSARIQIPIPVLHS